MRPKMFLRLLRSYDKTIILNGIKFSRFLSESSSSSRGRALKCYNSKEISSSMKLPVLKRVARKKPTWKETNILNQREEQYFNVIAYATADWYDLDRLKQRFISLSKPPQLIHISNMLDNVLCIQIHREIKEKSEAFIFDDGAVIFWNVQSDDEKLILNEVNKKFFIFKIFCFMFYVSFFFFLFFLIDEVSDNQYPKDLINNEKEIMNFIEVSTMSTINNDIIKVNCLSETEQLLDKYTFSNALALSVKLGIWEALLDDEVEFVADLANRLKQEHHIKIERGLMQRKSGELYSLKHAVNLSHDFLDTPDFYWSNSRLENLYKKIFNYFTIAKRTKVLNERLSFSLELISVIEASLNEKKHVRLEWIIITLIFAEVFFNIIDHIDFSTWKFSSKNSKSFDD
ncbi:unnamed protein product [Rotaria sordida]|uniref:DUF155 domain-containing protein n=2 Tax=Rotaria sordida TaxID=392033 RepID=A0A814UBB5_9BILA|nr:unnamed protein product [Rotaria sordida]